jgi:ABC-2 type transport system ATP-binding protein
VLATVAAHAQVVDLAVREPDIEDVVRRIYSATRTDGKGHPFGMR